MIFLPLYKIFLLRSIHLAVQEFKHGLGKKCGSDDMWNFVKIYQMLCQEKGDENMCVIFKYFELKKSVTRVIVIRRVTIHECLFYV